MGCGALQGQSGHPLKASWGFAQFPHMPGFRTTSLQPRGTAKEEASLCLVLFLQRAARHTGPSDELNRPKSKLE